MKRTLSILLAVVFLLTALPLGHSEMGTLTIEYHIVVPEVLPLLVPLGILVQHDPQCLSGEDQGSQ